MDNIPIDTALQNIYTALDKANQAGLFNLAESQTIIMCYNAIANKVKEKDVVQEQQPADGPQALLS